MRTTFLGTALEDPSSATSSLLDALASNCRGNHAAVPSYAVAIKSSSRSRL